MNEPIPHVCENCLPEQHERLRVTFGGISSWHVVRESTLKVHREGHEGWTRRAWDRRALCGALGALVTGSDVQEWVNTPLDLTRVNCKRCLASVRRIEEL